MQDPVDLELLKKFVRNQCNESEIEQIREFMRRPEYRQTLNKLIDQQWEAFIPEQEAQKAEMQDWKMEFEQRREINEINPDLRPKRNLRWVGYAAAACLLFPLFILFLLPAIKNAKNNPQVVMRETSSPAGQRSTITLPDGSIVTLGPKSRLKYPEAFFAGTREISLEGEGFFEVTKNPKKPFIVHAGHIQTRVLGTSFKIDALNRESVRVAVATGKVRVSNFSSGKEQILTTLTPGKQAGYNALTGKLEMLDVQIEDVKNWKNGLISLSGLSLADAFGTLERWYNVEILLGTRAKATKRIKLVVNGTRPVNEALETIKQLTGLNYRINGKKIQIY